MLRHIGKKVAGGLAAAALAATLSPAKPAHAQEVPCIGQLMVFTGPYCPRGWTNADGQLLQVNQNYELFSIIGTTYGGNGQSNFGLPDLRGRSVVHVGSGTGIEPTTQQGAFIGHDQFTIADHNMPSHNHAAIAVAKPADNQNPKGDLLGSSAIFQNDTATNRVQLSASMIGNTGGSLPVTKRSPAQVLRYCIATQGVYCSRQ